MKKIALVLILNACSLSASDSTHRPTTPPLIKAIERWTFYWGDYAKIDEEILKAKKSGTLEAINEKGETAIHATLISRDKPQNHDLLKKLISAGSSVHAKSRIGRTALHSAVELDDPEAVTILLEAGAFVDAQMVCQHDIVSGTTPLHMVTASLYAGFRSLFPFYLSQRFQNQIIIAQMLLSAGARTDIPDSQGRLPLAKLKNHHDNQSTLHILARKGEVALLKTLAGLGLYMHPEASPYNTSTPLHESGTVEVAQFLLEKGASIHALNSHGQTPLHTAKNGGVAIALLTAGANIHARDIHGQTPLHTAAAGNKIEVMQALLAYSSVVTRD